jgi:putative SOS response-associated peptidase YedK
MCGRFLLVSEPNAIARFYEWKATGKAKQPYLIRLRDGGLMAFAGTWERWQGEDGAVESVAILTTAANELMRPLHDRMPVILPPSDYERWLDAGEEDPEALRPLLTAYPSEALTACPVGPLVNNARHEGPECIRPAG